jgi:hypothetical protein
MSTNNFFDVENTKAVKKQADELLGKGCKRIVILPNITTKRAELHKDSFVKVLKQVFPYLNSKRDDLFFTLLTPQYIEALDLPNVEQVFYDVPERLFTMRVHFDAYAMEQALNLRKVKYDFVYSHLPELTTSFVHLINNVGHCRVRVIGYCHWWELEENCGFIHKAILPNLIGMLEMEECGVNSVWVKNLVVSKAKEFLGDVAAEKLDKIIQPHYLASSSDFKRSEKQMIPNSILFNHRPGSYTGTDWCLSQLDKLRKTRKDFQLHTTYEMDQNKSYMVKQNFPKAIDYINHLKRMTVGVGTFKGYSAWSLSVMDDLCYGLPCILPNDLCYPEMVGKDYPLLYNNSEEFLALLNKHFDDPNLRCAYEDKLKKIAERYSPKNTISKWFNEWSVFEACD